jgi:GNAT superfamily N-acetyltransferase
MGDARALVELHNAVAADLTRKMGSGYWSKERSIQRQFDRIIQSDGRPESRSIYLLEDGEEVVATLVLSTRRAHFWRKSMWSEPDAEGLCVFDLAVMPHRQGTGLGRQSMEFAEERARLYDMPYVRLDAFSQNPHSTAFYAHLGYQDRGQIVVNGVPLILYEKRV